MSILEALRGTLAVSCQAADGSPLQPTDHIVALAKAAVLGGAKAVRIEGVANVSAVRNAVSVPVIGITKIEHPDSEIYITPTLEDVRQLCEAGADIVAFDATARPRPCSVAALVEAVHQAGRIAMADISTLDEGRAAVALGADFAGTTLSGYTPYSPQSEAPDFKLMQDLFRAGIPFVAEGRIWEPADARRAIEYGAVFVVVGSAITRPDVITRRFAAAVAGAQQTPEFNGESR
ncbi:N-acetylmannosamine-6-phosphate 2-epimerase [Rhizobium leguminosarum]|uniref:N-acetylmannosamine-6-phosphate 2-epimerase n=1 Tax=Rhizobium leguminosarum TaxID=384 RepID=UPI001C970BC8|nr:N-acetylmannosamine-6-phosphate 2-epimerase [Rhizobium leguminosarum]MBY5584570.1 N-acetylmannosamine-6-phosphate 2-epimerase [Rhizobium leguminosarum]MBY5696954.1 N-acetylmannosamine-6-phosphate 2-epimerase [Rhizobium leguminosarum]MBY5766177.1 N-acetylmannosamine-6-phosphate 2-epimerase [Rhizobium leguminosarum]